jgi:hypothetical protein
LILAIDPGTVQSGWCLLGASKIVNSGVQSNDDMLAMIRQNGLGGYLAQTLAIEMIASYGMPVGREVFETCVWIGRFQQAWREPDAVRLVYRKDVKLYLCGSPRAKDGNIWQALKDKLGEVGTKKAPGPLYGVQSHARAALAVAVYTYDKLKGELQ